MIHLYTKSLASTPQHGALSGRGVLSTCRGQRAPLGPCFPQPPDLSFGDEGAQQLQPWAARCRRVPLPGTERSMLSQVLTHFCGPELGAGGRRLYFVSWGQGQAERRTRGTKRCLKPPPLSLTAVPDPAADQAQSGCVIHLAGFWQQPRECQGRWGRGQGAGPEAPGGGAWPRPRQSKVSVKSEKKKRKRKERGRGPLQCRAAGRACADC